MMSWPVVVIGAGPAGLTAAYELVKLDTPVLVLDKDSQVGGISRTETYKGYKFDIGGHRFYTKVSEVDELWHEVLGSDFIEVDRLSRIYYGGKFYHYPIRLWNTLYNLGPVESVRVLVSYLKAKARTPFPREASLEEWVINRFGERLYKMFFKTYTEKVWGIPCNEIRADWAAQRIKDLSLKRAVLNAFTKNSEATSLIERFRYPIHGPGMMWERFRQRVEDGGGEVRLNSSVETVHHDNEEVTYVTVKTPDGHAEVAADHFVTSMPITQLITRLSPAPPEHVLEAAKGLSYRDFIVVALICDRAHLFPDNWIYVHSPDVRVGRIQNFKNWSQKMVPDASRSCLGMEYFCTFDDDLWTLSDTELQKLATRELARIGLARQEEIVDGVVMRQRMAYPVYDEKYKQHLQVLRQYLDRFQNLSTVGRAGMHRYNNQDHSMLTAMLAVKNVMGEEHDLWNVNVERSYHEQFTISEAKTAKAIRLVVNAP